MRNTKQTLAIFVVWSCCASVDELARAQVPPPSMPDAMQKMFERFTKESSRFMPGFFSELPEDERIRLEQVNVGEAEEARYGKQVLDGYLDSVQKHGKEVISRGKDVDYLRQLAATIRPFMKNHQQYRQLDIRVVKTEATDAYSIPGGHLIFTSGLLDTISSEAALVGVIGHELAHIDHGHQLLPLKQSKRSNERLDFRSGMLAIAIMARPFRAEYESEADADAVNWMLRAGYDARELAHMLAQWQQRQDLQVPWIQMIPTFVRSHPDPGKRALAILERSENLSRNFPNATYIGRKNLQLRIPRSEREFAN